MKTGIFNARVYQKYTILYQLRRKFLKYGNRFLKANDTMNIAIEFCAKFCTKMFSFMKIRSFVIRRHYGGLAAERWRETAEGEWEVLDDYQFTPAWSHFTLNEYLRCPVWSCVVLCGPVWSCVVFRETAI